MSKVPKRLEWTNEEIEDIIDLYCNKNWNMMDIKNKYQEKYNLTTTKAIRRILNQYDIDIERRINKKSLMNFSGKQKQEICDMYLTGKYTVKFIADKYSCCTETIKKVLRENKIPIVQYPKHYKDLMVNESYFETIDTEEKAYFLGFIFADGNVFSKHRELSIEIHIRDIEILNKFKEELNTNNKISYRKRTNTEMACIRIISQKMIDDLAKYGIVDDKTHKTKHLPRVPQEFLRHFLRGLLDGDGWLTKDKNGYMHVGFVSYHKSNAQDFQDMCNTLIKDKNTAKITEKSKVKHSGYVSQFFAQSQVRQLVTALYKDSTIYLTRKYLRAEEFFELNDDEDIV